MDRVQHTCNSGEVRADLICDFERVRACRTRDLHDGIMPRSHLPTYEFRAETWDAISERAAEIAALDQNLRYVEDLVKSIRASGIEDELAGSFSMMDLRVAAVPVTTPPVEYIGVYGPASTPSTGNGKVRVVHR
ncbi:MAG TPA: hypothetical protein VL294_10130, partial [Pseudolysinimonas sp.]|nr:hypothetical protein [Pseudolysinimonas sp.]